MTIYNRKLFLFFATSNSPTSDGPIFYNDFDDTKTDGSIFYNDLNNIIGEDITLEAIAAASDATTTSRAAATTSADDALSTLLEKTAANEFCCIQLDES